MISIDRDAQEPEQQSRAVVLLNRKPGEKWKIDRSTWPDTQDLEFNSLLEASAFVASRLRRDEV